MHITQRSALIAGAAIALIGVLSGCTTGELNEDASETVETVNDIEAPSGYFDMGAGLAFKWVDNPNCNPTQNPYLICWGVEVLALRDCWPSPVNAMILDDGENLVENVTGSLPTTMKAGERRVSELLLAIPRSGTEIQYQAEIQTLECYDFSG